MATYTAITDAEIDQDSPITQTLLQKYRDNLIATAEGDASAPKISVTAFDADYYTAGGVGSYCFASGPTTAFGSTTAGSNLNPISALYNVNNMTYQIGAATPPPTGSALSGTWRCMGESTSSWIIDANGPDPDTIGYGATLWLRIE